MKGATIRRSSLWLLLLAALLVSCGKSTQDAFRDGMEAYSKGDYKTAMENWQPIAEHGDPSAQTNLGVMYSQGKGVKQDYAEAFKWYKAAAMQNYSDAEYNLAIAYKEGRGSEPNIEEAIRWFEYAAGQGHIRAMVRLGDIYFKGQGIKENPREGIKWYEKAAAKGDPTTQVVLGDIYARGNGTPTDNVRAYLWYSAAFFQEENGDIRARAAMSRMRVTNRMDEVEIAEAERQAEEWREIKRTEANR